MSGNGSIEIEGIDEVLRKYANAENDLSKEALTAARSAMQAVAKDIRSNSPSRFRSLVKTTAKRTKDGRIYGVAGYRNKHERSGHQGSAPVDDWFKAYWRNYGTLKHRVPPDVHKFDKPVKPASSAAAARRRNREGQRPELFFDRAVSGWERKFLDQFKERLKQRGYPVE